MPDAQQHSFEHEKWAAEQSVRDREVAVKEREQSVREQDLAVRKLEAGKAAWQSPLTVAIFAAAVAGLVNLAAIAVNGHLSREADEAHAESARISARIRRMTRQF